MNFVKRYEELYKGNEDIMKAWDELNDTQKTRWIVLFTKMDTLENERDEAYKMIGRLVVENPNVIPV